MREKRDPERVRGRRMDREEGDGEGEGDESGFRRIQREKERQMNVRGMERIQRGKGLIRQTICLETQKPDLENLKIKNN